MSNSLIGLVTVNFNSSAYTRKLLASLVANSLKVNSVVIVDNDSSDMEFSILEAAVFEYSALLNITLIRSESNLGYFGGLNLGLSKLDLYLLDGVVICNNDLSFPPNFFEYLSCKDLDKRVFAVCPSVRTIDQVYQNPSMAERPSFLRIFFYDLYFSNFFIGGMILKLWRWLGFGVDSNYKKDLVERPIFIGIGAIYYLTKNYFIHNGKLPNETFLYGEEAFLSRQISESGGLQLYCPDLEVVHFESISTNKLPGLNKYNLNKIAYKKYRDFFRRGV